MVYIYVTPGSCCMFFNMANIATHHILLYSCTFHRSFNYLYTDNIISLVSQCTCNIMVQGKFKKLSNILIIWYIIIFLPVNHSYMVKHVVIIYYQWFCGCVCIFPWCQYCVILPRCLSCEFSNIMIAQWNSFLICVLGWN